MARRTPHRSGPALELAPLPPARAPLRGLREAERDATAPAGDAARRRPVAGKGDRWHHERRVLDQRPRGLGRPASPLRVRPGRGLNTTKLGNGTHVLQVHGIAGPGQLRHRPNDDRRRQQGLRAHQRGRAAVDEGAGTVKPARPAVGREGEARRLPGRRPAGERSTRARRSSLAWGAKRAKPGRHVLQVVATVRSTGRDAQLRIPLVVSQPKPRPKPKPKPPGRGTGAPRSPTRASSDGQAGDTASRSGASTSPDGRARVEFLIDGKLRGTGPRSGRSRSAGTLTSETPGSHELEARAFGAGGGVTVPGDCHGRAAVALCAYGRNREADRPRPALISWRSTRCSTTKSARSATPCARSSASRSCRTSATGSSRDPPARADRGARQARPVRHAPRRLRAAGRERRRLRAHLPRARGRRLGRPQRRLRPGVARDVLDLALGLGGAEAALAAARCTPARRSAASA